MKKLFTALFSLLMFAATAQSATVNITYRYVHNGTVWYTETKTATVGEAYPDIIAQPAGVKYLNAPIGTVTSATTVDIECTYTNKAVSNLLAENLSSASWCFLTLGNYHLRYVSGQSYTTVDKTVTTRPAATDYSYQWKIYGNPIQGFKIVNREAGTSSILTSVAPTGTGESTFPVVAAESGINTTTNNIYWDMKEGAGLSFYLARKGETAYLNHYASRGKLAFWTTKADAGSLFGVVPVDETLTGATTFSATKYYMLVNRHTGAALGEGQLRNYNASVTAGSDVYEDSVAVAMEANTDNHGAIWRLEQSGTGYKLKNYNTGNYLSATKTVRMTATGGNGTTYYYVQKCDTEGTAWYLCPTADGYYNLTSSTNTATGASEKVALCDDGYFAQFWTTFSMCSEWELREVTPTSASTPTYATSITSGRYYRFVNYSLPTLAMTESLGKVSGTPIDENSYGQIWKVTSASGGYTLQNALTGKYIQTAPGTSTQFSTGSTSKTFSSGNTTASGNRIFYFYTSGTNYYTALHCASSQNYNVVGWQATSDASRWYLQEVTLSSADLAAIEAARPIVNGTGTNYTTQLSNFFSDYACTTLKSTYANMTDAQLRSAMSSLPTDLQNMAVRVKNDMWNTEEGSLWNHYEKDFRIHDYEIYSDCSQWQSVTGIGVFAHLTNPTGIQAKPGDIIYLFVGSNVQDSDATLQAELVEGTKTTGSTVTLSRGYNAIYVSTECEVFISYILNNTSKSCNNYPDITVHIEGGTCNGFFDMYRGHTNNDWIWLKENMFQNKYLHVKGNSVLLNVEREDVYAEQNATGVMKIWDFIFDTEESFAGCDQWKNTGRYKMMLNSFQNEDRGTNPFWNGANHGTSHPDLTSSGTFNYNGLANGGLWEVAHEIGHGHQIPIIRSAGTDETSNNVMSQIIQFLPKDNIDNGLFQSAKATRGDGVKRLTEHFTDGMSYIDMIRRRMIVSGVEGNDNITNRWLFQLWMYYDYLGHYQPTGGNNGFAFVSALYDKLRATPLGTSVITTPAQDYLRMAQFCAEIVETDLSEFFEVWGFWRTTPKYTGLTIPTEYASESTTKTDTGTTYYVGGYTNRAFDMSNATSQVNTVRSAMQAYSKKGNNIIFIEDRGVGCTLSQTMDGLNPQTLGDHGYYEDFTKSITGQYQYAVDGTTVTMSGGENAVGFKIYDNSGNLVAISNMDTFSVPAAVATGLENGTYTLKVAQGDGTDIVATGEDTEPAQPTEQALYCIQSWRSYGFVKHNGDGAAVTQTLDYSDEAAKFYFVPVNGTDWTAGVKIVSNVTGKQLVDVGTGFADSGTTWYIKENPYKAGFYCISKTSDLSSGCWDCNTAGGMTAAYWQPSASDNDGTSWQIIRAEDLPQFQTSTLAEPKWYYIKSGRSDRYLYANGTSLNSATSNAKSDAYKFAFIKTENNGVQVVNKAGLDSGSNQYLSTTPGLSGTAATWYYYNYAKGEGYFMLAKEEIPLNTFTGNYFGGYDGSGSWNYRLLHVNGSGGLTYWWNDGTGNIGNIYQIEEVVTTCDVTYTYTYNGTTYSATETQNIGDAVSLPASITFPYTNYTFSAATVPSASTATINVTVTGFTGMPFETSSDYATATWYYLHGHGSYTDRYISTNEDATVWGQGNGKTDAYKWAFIGDPIQGVKLINKASGNGKYLQGTNPATMGTDGKAWILQQQTNTTFQSGENGFGLWDATLTYLNTQGTTLKYWGSFDQGSTFWVEAVPTNYADNVVADVGAFFAADALLDMCFSIPTSVKTQWQSAYDAYSQEATYEQYIEITEAIQAAMIYPESGKQYRIMSLGTRDNGTPTFIYSDGTNLKTATAPSRNSSSFTFTGTFPSYQLSVDGLNVQPFPNTAGTASTVSSEAGSGQTFRVLAPGIVAIHNYPGSSADGLYFHEDASHNVVSWYAYNENAGGLESSRWLVVDITLAGDADANGVVTQADLPWLVSILLGKEARTDGADVDGDGNVTLRDVTSLVNLLRSME